MLINTSRNPFTAITTILASIGAINWGLIGIFNLNLVTSLFGEYSSITRIIYVLIGISGLYTICVLTKVLYSPATKMID